MAAGPKIITEGLTMYLDAANSKSYSGGSTWKDLTENNNNITLYSDPIFSAKNQGSLNFIPTADYGESATGLLNGTAYTKIAWYYPETGVNANNIISGGASGNHAFYMHLTDDSLKSGHNGTWDIVQYVHSESMLNKWNFGAVTFDNVNGWSLYYNGVLVDTDAATDTPSGGNGVIRIAAHNAAANSFDGEIPLVMLYNRALTAEEIRHNYIVTSPRFSY